MTLVNRSRTPGRAATCGRYEAVSMSRSRADEYASIGVPRPGKTRTGFVPTALTALVASEHRRPVIQIYVLLGHPDSGRARFFFERHHRSRSAVVR